MQHQSPEAFANAHPASQWTGEVKARFLDCLSQRGNVRAACKSVGLSAETAYRQRRRDAVFARAWAAAMALARRVSEQVLADRAIDGVEEEVWHRGEMVGTRRKFDSRLLLAHLGRLDKAVDEDAEQDADRFDELLAVIAGEELPGENGSDRDDALPLDRQGFVERALDAACEAVLKRRNPKLDEAGDIEDRDEAIACDAETEVECDRAFDAASAEWDDWQARAFGRVDALVGDCSSGGEGSLRFSSRTPSTASIPALACALPTSPRDGGDCDHIARLDPSSEGEAES